MTSTEKVLWFKLRNRKTAGAKFRRQQTFGPYVLDFYCAEHKLNIELDGGQHGLPEQRSHDRRREEFLAQAGVTTLRFWNSQIRKNLKGVLLKIRMTIEALPHNKKSEMGRRTQSTLTPALSPEGRGRKTL